MSILYENRELASIKIDVKNTRVVGKNHCTEIRVVCVEGQMSNVPWALVRYNHWDNELINLALVLSVELKNKEE